MLNPGLVNVYLVIVVDEQDRQILGHRLGDRVLCYVGPNDSEWFAFDCWEEPITRYVVEDGHFRHNFRTEREEDPLLRNVRVLAPSFNESLILTTYGKVLRWGPVGAENSSRL